MKNKLIPGANLEPIVDTDDEDYYDES